MSETVTAGAAAAAPAATKRWWYVNLASPDKVLQWLNGNPAQGPGEMCAMGRPDGTVDLYYFSKLGP